jgi:hypothetical protein
MYALASDFNNDGVYLVQYFLGTLTGTISSTAKISFGTSVYYVAQN